MFYVIHYSYRGPNSRNNPDFDYVEITTQPARKNGKAYFNGWCGETNGVRVTALGKFDTLESAREQIVKSFGAVRSTGTNDNEHAVEVYKIGRFVPLNAEQSAEYIWKFVNRDVSAETTDDEGFALARKYELAANDEGFRLNSVSSFIFLWREFLREV